MENEIRHVLVVGTGSLLDESIKSLLIHEPELKVATAMYANPTLLLEDLEPGFPDVIILNESGRLDRTRAFELLQEISPQQTCRVIIIRPDDDILEVYDKQCLKAAHNGDLINIIRHR